MIEKPGDKNTFSTPDHIRYGVHDANIASTNATLLPFLYAHVLRLMNNSWAVFMAIHYDKPYVIELLPMADEEAGRAETRSPRFVFKKETEKDTSHIISTRCIVGSANGRSPYKRTQSNMTP